MPSNCKSLLPDIDPFLNFFNETGALWIDTKPGKSKKIFKILAFGNLYNSKSNKTENPIFNLIKRKLCKCFELNNQKIFTANSVTVRKYLKENLIKMLDISKQEYVSLITKNYINQLSNIRKEQNSSKVIKLKNEATKEAINESKIQLNKIKKIK